MSSTIIDNYLEVVNPEAKRGDFASVLFDFDGTISVIREGWQDVMGPLMIEVLKETPNCESEDKLDKIVRDFIAVTTGKDTIYQMMGLAEEVEKRGGTPAEPMEYKKEYLRRLWKHIEHKVDAVKSGKVQPDDMMMVGARALLDDLKARGLKLYLASGTDHPNVVDEATALGVEHYFGEHIYGALDNYWERSKAKVIKDILEKNNLSGTSLLTFGDGFVEIENCKEVGGLAVGVASNEAERQGGDEWKRGRLIEAGADIIVPDYGRLNTLTDYLFSK